VLGHASTAASFGGSSKSIEARNHCCPWSCVLSAHSEATPVSQLRRPPPRHRKVRWYRRRSGLRRAFPEARMIKRSTARPSAGIPGLGTSENRILCSRRNLRSRRGTRVTFVHCDLQSCGPQTSSQTQSAETRADDGDLCCVSHNCHQRFRAATAVDSMELWPQLDLTMPQLSNPLQSFGPVPSRHDAEPVLRQHRLTRSRIGSSSSTTRINSLSCMRVWCSSGWTHIALHWRINAFCQWSR
jgi:hypothetical protein